MQEKIGRYSISSRLGRGGMGSVYLASDPVLNRKVAIKMVDFTIEEVSRRVFLRERLLRDAKAAALLSHPNVVSVFDVVEEGESAFVVMEYVPGESLSSYLDRIPIPDTAFTLSVLRQMAAALDYTHGKGIIHRDIKPSNVMTAPDGIVKILDFGVARISDGRTATVTDVVMGTVEYMSPEQVKGEALDGRSDQFSMAGVGYRMFTGGTMFGEQSMATLAYKLVSEMPPPARVRNGALPAGVDEVLNRSLAKTPSDRFPTCGEFVEALVRAFQTAPTRSVVAKIAPPVATGARAPKRLPRGWLAAACGVVVAGGLLFWKWSAFDGRQTVGMKLIAPPQPAPVVAQPASVQPVEPKPQPRAQAVPKKARPITAETGRVHTPAPAAAPSEPAQPKPAPAPDTAEIARLFSQGQQQIQRRDFAGAVESFSAVLGVSPDFQRAYFSRGLARELAEQFETAITDYSLAIKLNPLDAQSYLRRGVCLVRTRQDDQAFADFNRALEIKADMPMALNGRGGIYLRRRNFAEAIRDFDAAVAINPRIALVYANRARARRALGNITGAEEDQKKAEELKEQKN